ncbi:serine/threonine protein phosphatase [Streptomyces oceani]|uniref:Serine/threonine protein phosphatase n=1 Tax=Streptomyces oceani TaxID=1075402 RepID=A0A1E7KNZ8_9ACTN|nr:serine/threonine protein phosphatase [Streptomyces oceani]
MRTDDVRGNGISAGSMIGWLILLTVLLLVTGYLGSRETRLIPFLIFLPGLVAGRGTVRQTAFAAGWVLLAVSASIIARPLESLSANISLIAFTTVLGGLSVAMARQRIVRQQEIARLRSATAALQRQILRPLPLLTDQLLINGLYEAVEEDTRVGGDIYEVVSSPYGSRVLIADVQGKGLPAIGAAFAVLGAFREAASREPTLTAVVDDLEAAVLRHNAFAVQTGEPERFVTALLIGVTEDEEAQVVNCGHVEPYLLHIPQPGPVLREEPDVPLGLGALAREPRTVEWFDFPGGSTLLLFTDGITEARSPSGAFFPLVERLPRWNAVPPAELAGVLRDELHTHAAGSPRDDVAVLVLRRTGGSPPP